jgi:hypothetical protein
LLLLLLLVMMLRVGTLMMKTMLRESRRAGRVTGGGCQGWLAPVQAQVLVRCLLMCAGG